MRLAASHVMRYYDEDTQDVALGQVKINVPDTSNLKEVQVLLRTFLEVREIFLL